MSNKKFSLLLLTLLLVYFAMTLFKLLALPVFADEAIYIRWAQLIIDDAQRYFFYPMNDGKTPLLMWLIVPFQFIFSDQLYASRFVSVLAGALTVIFISLITKELSQKKSTALLAAFLTIILPFTFFHQRLAITDALLLANLSASYFFVLKLSKSKNYFYLLPLSLSFFLAIMSKTPALLFIPSLFLTSLLNFKKNEGYKKILKLNHPVWQSIFKIGLAIFISLLIFYSFRVVPLFSQLFSVGGSFLYPFPIIFKKEVFEIIERNAIFFATQLIYYLGPIVLLTSLPLMKKNRWQQFILLLSALSILLPLTLVGKVIYPRYLLPTSIFFIVSSSLFISNISKKFLKIVLLILIIIQSFNFIYWSYFNINHLPLSPADRRQYLEDWAAGQGIKESTEIIQKMAENSTVAVATEGFFGTLPDGILLYLHGENVNNILVEGIGQPVISIPENFANKAINYQHQILIVNSHRLLMPTGDWQLLTEYCRPNNAPCLQVWKIK